MICDLELTGVLPPPPPPADGLILPNKGVPTVLLAPDKGVPDLEPGRTRPAGYLDPLGVNIFATVSTIV